MLVVMQSDATKAQIDAVLGKDDWDYYGSSVVALNTDTGQPVWHYQFVHKDIWDYDTPAQPMLFDYKAAADASSMLNTPPTFAWYMAGLVFKWLKRTGGLAAVGERNRVKADTLYAAIDASFLYKNPIARDARSWMNVAFILKKPGLDAAFLAQAAHAGRLAAALAAVPGGILCTARSRAGQLQRPHPGP